MPPHLPTELLQHLLALALEDGSPGHRQQTRHAFGLVCTAWHYSVHRWREVDVVGSKQAAMLAGVLRAEEEAVRLRGVGAGAGEGRGVAEPARGAVRRVCLDLNTAGGPAGGTKELLKLLSGLERLEVVLTEDPADELADAIAEGRGLRHLEVRGSAGRMDRPRVTAEWLKRILPHLPRLESLTLRDAWFKCDAASAPNLFVANTYLIHIFIGTSACEADYVALLAALPAGLRSLALDDPELHLDEGIDALLARHLDLSALASLTSLSLLDTTAHCPTSCGRAWRGGLDSLLANATRLERLTVSPCAVSNLGTVLGPLAGLVELKLREGAASPCRAVSAGEVVDFLEEATGLRRMRLCKRTSAMWSEAARGEVAQAGRRRGVRVLWD